MAKCLKWENEVIGIIRDDYSVEIKNGNLNRTVQTVLQGKDELSKPDWKMFLEDRIVSKTRRDIDKFLFCCGLSSYDVFRLADKTRAINPKDKFWISFDPNENYADCVGNTLQNIFLHNTNIDGGSIHSPDGMNVKWYGTYQDHYGIFKKRLSPVQTDVESELAVCAIAKEMGIPCCQALRVDEDTMFSAFHYDVNNEYIVHFGNLFQENEREENEVEGILKIRPQYQKEIFQMLVLDFVTRQDDRHLSNFSVKVKGEQESFYDLYDNGRSLFFEDSPKTVALAVANVKANATSFGTVGTYWDHICDMLKKNPSLGKSVKLDLAPETVHQILVDSGFEGYRLEGAQEWILQSTELLQHQIHEVQLRQAITTEFQKEAEGKIADDLIMDDANLMNQINEFKIKESLPERDIDLDIEPER